MGVTADSLDIYLSLIYKGEIWMKLVSGKFNVERRENLERNNGEGRDSVCERGQNV